MVLCIYSPTGAQTFTDFFQYVSHDCNALKEEKKKKKIICLIPNQPCAYGP